MNITQVAIIGAGPAGLCLARSLADLGLRVTLVERLPERALAQPAFDGREIALTQRSITLMKQLGLWERIPSDDISPLRRAKVLNGTSSHAIHVAPHGNGDTLGALVPNHRIRQAAFEAVREMASVTLLTEQSLDGVRADADVAELRLSGAPPLRAELVVAADSRFSESRRALGIPARMHDFGKSMLVCRISHEVPHEDSAWEWFGHAQTLALLPLGRGADGRSRSSVVLTLPPQAMRAVQALDDEAFARDLERRFDGRLGAIDASGERHVYPLVGTYASRFVGPRFALVGDAAVGMHPVTAHGFNFGLLSVERLSSCVARAVRSGTPIHEPALLSAYDRGHRRDTLPLYLATRGIVGLFTDDRWPARTLRSLALRGADALPGFTRLLASRLSDAGRAA